jgi:signal transduction histidine kinase/CheY-like chemotaxis protein
LSSALLILFYFMLTKPLKQIIGAVQNRDMHSPDRTPLLCPSGHEQDEIGVLVAVSNRQLDSIAREMEQRRYAEDRLTSYLGDLEAIVAARTFEIKEANTLLRQTNQKLEQARRDAVAMAQSRSTFLANMSHEIRTPLNGLLGMLALSLEGHFSSEQRQQLSIAYDSGKVLTALLNDILDLSKFEAGQLQLESIDFDLGTLVEGTASLLSQSVAADVELTCLIDTHFPVLVEGDPTRIRQIISNLLSNALKFTREGRVDIRVSHRDDKVKITVSDTGIGIAEEAQARIFQPFTQAAADIARQFGGTGLGLTLARHLCEMMHGQLQLNSRLGSGSTFTVELPLACVVPATQPEPLHGKVIAICDESSGLAELLESQAALWGLDYQRMNDAQHASEVDADLLISNCLTSATDYRTLRDTPIVLVTTYNGFLTREQAVTLAPLEQLARPLSRQSLLQIFKHRLPARHNLENAASVSHLKKYRHARVLLVEDNHVNQLVAKGMLEKQKLEVIIAINGCQALERLEEQTPDLILMDCNMPVMDGYEASRRIRSDSRWQHLPIIALTANVLAAERSRCLDAGMNDYLAKPFRREELLALLEQWLPVDSSLSPAQLPL